MEYISNVLCHFVGRTQKSDEDRYQLLIKIIKGNRLIADLKNPDNPSVQLNSGYKGTHVGEVFEQCSCVCFCDIPDDMLNIHTSKYNKFGMGFDKNFLSQKGVRPVLYVPSSVKITEYGSTNTPKQAMDYYLTIIKQASYLYAIMSLLNQAYPIRDQLLDFKKQYSELAKWVDLLDDDVTNAILENKTHEMLYSNSVAWATLFSYIKVFDETLPLNHPDNYYMEREWRSICNIDFTLDDIQKIYMPSKEYCEKFAKEFPEYKGMYYVLE